MKLTAPHQVDPRRAGADPESEVLDRETDVPPTVWLLIDDRPGHRTQVVGLARWLDWPAVEKRIDFNLLNRLPNPLLGASLISLKGKESDPLEPPYPDIIIGMGRRIVPVARRIRRDSGGRTAVVLLGRKTAANPRDVDLWVACAHFRLLPRPALLELTLPPTQVDKKMLMRAITAHGDPLNGMARPRVLLLVGGPTAQHHFDSALAGELAGQVAAAALSLGGSLAVVTSRRTPPDAVAAMRLSAPQAHVHEWRAERHDNPYLAYLAAADLIVVTGESESMLAETAATGCPLTIYPLPVRAASAKQRLAAWIRRCADGSGAWASVCRRLLSDGWIAPPRDLDLMHRLMVAHGQACLLADGLNRTPPRPAPEPRELVNRITALLRRPRAAGL